MYHRHGVKWSKHIDFMLLDVLALEVCFYVVYYWYFDRAPFGRGDSNFAAVALLAAFGSILVSFFAESYSGILRRGYLKEAYYTIAHMAGVLFILLLYMYFAKVARQVSRIFVGFSMVSSTVLAYAFRTLNKEYIRHRYLSKPDARYELIILTQKDRVDDAIKYIQSPDIHILGLCIYDDSSVLRVDDVPVLASFSKLLDYMKSNVVDGLFIYLDRNTDLPREFIDDCISMGISVHTCIGRIDSKNSNQSINKIGRYTVLTQSVKMISTREVFFKRLMDITGGLIGCVITLLLTAFIGPMIFISSPGPIFFSQIRVGKNGRKFKIYKFRSMYMDAEQRKAELMSQNNIRDGMMFKMDDDPRIIKGIGHFIRDYSIDEFPQFWNVLKGDMSIVGTRPPTVEEYEKYSYHHKARLATKPGITGLWQVSGRSNITDFEEVVKLDTEYITNWSLDLDIKIILKTVLVVLKKDGAK